MLGRFSGRWPVAAAFLVAACVGSDQPSPVSPNLEISDAGHSGGTAGFFFLPPMVWEDITPTGRFDATLLPQVVVEVCELAGSTCGPVIARFTPDGEPFRRVTVSRFTIGTRVFDQYLAVWRTDAPAVSGDKTYRAVVFLSARPLGHADVKLVRTHEQAQSVDRTQYTLWVKGLPLLIRFRIEEGVLVPAPGNAVALEASGFPSAVVAGEPSSLTITARDAAGNIATGYRGMVSFTSSDPAATLPSEYTFTATDAGVHTFAGVAFETAGAATLRTADTGDPGLFAELTLTVQPAAAATLVLTGLSDAAAGSAQTLTVTAYDEFGNVATGYTGTIAFTSTDAQATVPEAYTFAAADAGTHSFSGIVLRTAGSATVTGTDQATATLSGSQTVTVGPATATTFIVRGLSDAAAGTTHTLTVTAHDASGNVASGYTGSIAFTSTDPNGTLPDAYTFTAGDAGSHVFAEAITLRTAGSRTVTATDQAIATISGAQTVIVTPAGAASLELSGIAEPATAGQTYELTVTVRDAFGNVATGYTATVQFASSDPAAELPAPYPFQPSDGGIHAFAGVAFKRAGTQLLQAGDGTIGANAAVTVEPAAAAVLRFTTQPSAVPANEAISPPVVVTAYDAFDNIATAFAGPVTAALGTNPGAGTLSGTLSVGAPFGVATFNDLHIDNGGNGYTIVASAGGVAGAISDAFDVAFPGMVVVSPGRAHACALDPNGRAFCWGQSESGQLGNGSTATRVTPTPVSGGLRFASIDAGSFHTCAITHAGVAYCWGINQAGRLGDGSSTNRLEPVPVAGNHVFSMISAGERNTCGVTTSHQAYCWGEGAFNALGSGSTTSASSPVLVAGGHSFASVSVGTDFACGVTMSGEGLCWGTAGGGALGSGSTAPQSTPGAVAGNLTFVSISAGQAHACGVTTAGTGQCWGVGQFGRLGNGSGLNSLTPVPVSGNLVFAQISAGALHSCGVSTAGTGYCWGGNIDGDLGTGSPFSATTPALVLGGLSWTAIDAGGLIPPSLSSSNSFSFTCGVSAAGQTYCWGSGAQGQLGNGSTSPRGTPAAVAAFP